MIRIINLRNLDDLKDDEIIIRVDRENPILGNRFYMKNEWDRFKVIEQYREWFEKEIENNNEELLEELRRIYRIAKTNDVALACWCHPRKCHGEVVLDFLNKYL